MALSEVCVRAKEREPGIESSLQLQVCLLDGASKLGEHVGGFLRNLGHLGINGPIAVVGAVPYSQALDASAHGGLEIRRWSAQRAGVA